MAIGSSITLSKAKLNLKIVLLIPSKHSSEALALSNDVIDIIIKHRTDAIFLEIIILSYIYKFTRYAIEIISQIWVLFWLNFA